MKWPEIETRFPGPLANPLNQFIYNLNIWTHSILLGIFCFNYGNNYFFASLFFIIILRVEVIWETMSEMWIVEYVREHLRFMSLFYTLLGQTENFSISQYIYIYIYRQHFFVNANFIKHNRHFMPTYFLLDPFEFPYYFYRIRRKLIYVLSIVVCIPSTFCPTLGHHQGRIYYKSDVTFVLANYYCVRTSLPLKNMAFAFKCNSVNSGSS